MTVETEGVIPPEVANQVVESATAALEDLEKAKVEADDVKVDFAALGGAEVSLHPLDGSILLEESLRSISSLMASVVCTSFEIGQIIAKEIDSFNRQISP